MSEQIVTSPIITDETGQDILDKLDDIKDALNPNAQGVSFDKTGCQIITTNNVQDAVKQLDTGLDDTNSNLAQLETVQTATSSSAIAVNGTFQIPADILAHEIIIVGARRQGNGNTATFRKSELLAMDNGFELLASTTEGYRVKCNSTGLLTLVSKTSGLNEPFLTATGIF